MVAIACMAMAYEAWTLRVDSNRGFLQLWLVVLVMIAIGILSNLLIPWIVANWQTWAGSFVQWLNDNEDKLNKGDLALQKVFDWIDKIYFNRNPFFWPAWYITLPGGLYLLCRLSPDIMAAIVVIIIGVPLLIMVFVVLMGSILASVLSIGYIWSDRRKKQIPYSALEQRIVHGAEYISTIDLFKRFAQAKVGSPICPYIVLPKHHESMEVE